MSAIERIPNKLIPAITLLLMVVLPARFAFANACRLHDVNDPSVPECPSGNALILPDAYPVMAVSLSDDLGGSRWVKDFVSAALEAEPNKPPQFILNVRPSTLEEVKKMILKSNQPDDKKKLWLSSLTRVNSATGWNWHQDFMQMSHDSTGRPTVRPNKSYSRGNEARDATVRAIQQACDLKVSPYQVQKPDLGGRMGGNIEGGPGGLCVVGSDHFRGGEWENLRNEMCQNSPSLKAPTAFLGVGHTDEIFTTIRTGPGKCDLAVAVASPLAALETIRKSPDVLAVSGGQHRDRARVSQYYADLCAAIARFDRTKASNPASGKSNGTQGNRPMKKSALVSGIERLLPWAMAAGVSLMDDQNDECLSRLGKLTNSDLNSVIEGDPNLTLLNGEIQRQMTEFKSDLAKKFAGTECPSPKIIDFPSLFKGRSQLGAGGDVHATDANGIFSNPTNLQQIGNTLIMPDPHNSALRADLEKRVKEAGPNLKVKFIDTQFAHASLGNLHCSTNTVRYCRPAGGSQ